jgi:hypothetical protein
MTFPGIVLAVVAVTVAIPAPSNAQAARPGFPITNVQARAEQSHHDEVCGVKSIRGTYVFAATGFNIVAGVALPKAIVEVIEFNGDGTLSVPAATLSANGVIVRSVHGTGTYTVADDCSGTILFAGPTFDIFLSPDGDTIWMIQNNPNTVFQGTATRTTRGRGPR